MEGHSELLRKEDCLLLLVDIQKTMLDPCVDADRLTGNTAALIDVANILNIPVLFSVQNQEKLGGFTPELIQKVANPKIYNKLEFSCFQDEAFLRAMQEHSQRTILLSGIETHICILQTALNALSLGYKVHLAGDAVACRSRFNQKAALRRMEKAGAVISSTEMIIYELLNRAGSPEFKTALPLLKKL